jgi:2-polyprenyl-3-methyl-5-hydroxy-6-metoxy-1,4-benzoquinol methylase
MNANMTESFPFPRLKPGQHLTTAEALARLDYCLEWRAWLWRKAAITLLAPFERFKGKRVLEVGARFGKMSCLLASAGATVTGMDVAADAIEKARLEAARWGVEDRVRFAAYDGDGRNLPPGPFDVIFSKSVLVLIRKDRLPDLLSQLRSRLAPDGAGLFLENANNWFLDLLRKHVVHRREKKWDTVHWGFYPANLSIVETAFGPLRVQRFNSIVWAIRGGGNGLESVRT